MSNYTGTPNRCAAPLTDAQLDEAGRLVSSAPQPWMRTARGDVEYGPEIRPGVRARLTLDDLAELASVVPSLVAEVRALRELLDGVTEYSNQHEAVRHLQNNLAAARETARAESAAVSEVYRKARAALHGIATDDPIVQCLVARLGEGTQECDANNSCVACDAAARAEKLRDALQAIIDLDPPPAIGAPEPRVQTGLMWAADIARGALFNSPSKRLWKAGE